MQKIFKKIEKLYENKALISIQEITYVYSDTLSGGKLNETLFCDFAGINRENNLNIDEIIKITKDKLNSKIKEINNLISDIKEEKIKQKNKDDIRLDFIIRTLEYTKKTLLMAKYGLVFEVEKIYKNLRILSGEDKQKALNKVKKIDEQLFGGQIKDNPEEIELCVNFLAKHYKKYSTEDKLYFENFINIINNDYNTNYNLKNICEKDCKIEKKDKKREEILNKKIPQEKYLEIFREVLKIYGIEDKFDIRTSPDRGNIYDGPNFLEFPESEKYKTFTFRELTKLIVHEVERHILTLHANHLNLGNIQGANKLPLEEGLATLMEYTINQDVITKRGVRQVFLRILAFELLETNEALEFCGKLSKYDKNMCNVTVLYRRKRNYSLYEKGVQHKDTSYTRGYLKLQKEIGKTIFWEDLFVGRVGFSDLKLIKKIAKKQEIKRVLPCFITEFIKYNFLNINNFSDFNIEKFINYLEKKYYFINFEFITSGEKYRELIKNKILNNKKSLNKILNLIDK
ncbi:MAG: DUF1704 domain-containing protein [Candidatus Gracilibacteria bacterium]|nr:DUF1704 domain-containing protein [Candidatus Gracilibacteria bacterium]